MMLKLNSLETSKFLSGFNGKMISFDSKHTKCNAKNCIKSFLWRWTSVCTIFVYQKTVWSIFYKIVISIPHSWGGKNGEFKIFQIILHSYSLIWLWSLLLFLAEIWEYSKLAFGRYEVQALSNFEIYWFWVISRLTLSTALQSLVWVLYFLSSFIHIA